LGGPDLHHAERALLLDPARDEPAPTFYRKRMARVGIPLLVWAWFYFFWTWAFYGAPVDRTFVIRALLDGLTYNHLYFLFLILGSTPSRLCFGCTSDGSAAHNSGR